LAFVIAITLTIPITIVLTSQGIKYTHDRENEHLELRMNMFRDIVKAENLAITTAEEWFDREPVSQCPADDGHPEDICRERGV
jgi:hypothetical protein